MRLSGRNALAEALESVGERLACDGVTCTLVVVGGATPDLLRSLDRPTHDVDLQSVLERAVAHVQDALR